MVVDALQLLNEREFCHPSRIVSSSMTAGEFRLSIAGYPWWQAPRVHDEGTINFLFSSVTDGEVSLRNLLDHDEIEALLDFEICLTSSLE